MGLEPVRTGVAIVAPPAAPFTLEVITIVFIAAMAGQVAVFVPA